MASEPFAATFTKCSRRDFFTKVQIPQLPVRARVERGSQKTWEGGEESWKNKLRTNVSKGARYLNWIDVCLKEVLPPLHLEISLLPASQEEFMTSCS